MNLGPGDVRNPHQPDEHVPVDELVTALRALALAALASSTISADHNLFWNVDDPLVGTSAVLADPLLDATYHLASDSPARDAWAVVGNVTVDFDGDPRPVGGYDIGADEIALPAEWM